MTDLIIVKLTVAIDVAGEPMHSLQFMRPKVKHLKLLDHIDGDVDKAVTLISKLARVPEEAVEELDAVDFMACSEVIEKMMSKKPRKTGKR